MRRRRRPIGPSGRTIRSTSILDRKLIEQAKPALETKTPVTIEVDIKNVDRSAGAMLSGDVAKRYGHKGLKDDTITVKLTGTAGQSFGAFLAARYHAST